MSGLVRAELLALPPLLGRALPPSKNQQNRRNPSMLLATHDCVSLPDTRHNSCSSLTHQSSLHDNVFVVRLIESSVSEPSVSTPTLIRHFLHRGTRNTCSMFFVTHDCVSLPDPRLDLCSSLTHQSSLRDNVLPDPPILIA